MQILNSRSIRIGRDNLTNTSRGVCYVEMNSLSDAMFLHNQLLGEPPTIDDKLVSVSYYRSPGSQGAGVKEGGGNAAAAMAAAQWSHSRAVATEMATTATTAAEGVKRHSVEEVERLAEYSAEMYAKTPEEKAHYLEYYRKYYREGGQVSGAAAAPGSGGGRARPDKASNGGTVTVDGVEYRKYRKWRNALYKLLRSKEASCHQKKKVLL